MQEYRVLVRLPNGSQVWTVVHAGNIGQARSLAEAQYEKNRVLQVVNSR